MRGIRAEFERPPETGDGFRQFRLSGPEEAQVVVRGGKVRFPMERLPVAGRGFVEMALGGQGNAQVVVRRGVFRVQVEGAAMAGRGLVQFPLPLQNHTQSVVRFDIVRFEFDRPPETRCRLFGFPLFPQGPAEIVEGLGPAGPQREGPVQAINASLVAAKLSAQDAEQVPCVRFIRVHRENLPVQLLRRLQVAGLVVLNGNCQCFGNACHWR